MIKIVATINDAGMAANVGGPVESVSEIIEVPGKSIPPNLKRYIEDRQRSKVDGTFTFRTVTFSLLEDEATI